MANANSAAYQYMKGRLIDGELKPGSRVPIDAVAASLEISRQPVMEALRFLSAEGFVEIRPQVGTIVADYSNAEIRDFFSLFSAIEGEAAALAAERRQPSQLADAKNISSEIGALLTMQEPEIRGERYRFLNRDFHACIQRMSGTKVVEEMVSGLYDRAEFFVYGRSAHHRLSEIIEARHKDHVAMLQAIERGDVKEAKRLTAQHVYATVELMRPDPVGPRE